MKKVKVFSYIIVLVMMVSLCIPFVSGARIYDHNPLFKNEVGDVKVPLSSPSVDGNIGDGEGWSLPTNLNASNLACDATLFNNRIATDITANVYFAQDENGLYIAANIHDFTLNPITASESAYVDLEEKGTVDPYGMNGDDFVFCYDPLHAMVNGGFDHSDYSCWYNIGFTANDKGGYDLKVYRTRFNEGDLDGQFTGAVKVGENEWTFEIMFPWSVLLSDAQYTSFGQFNSDYTDIIAVGSSSAAGIEYVDRAFNEDFGEVCAINRYATVPNFKHGGEVGPISTISFISSYGINLISTDTAWTNTFSDVSNTGWYLNAVKYVNGKGYMNGTSGSTFSGTMTLSRGMFITVLGRLAQVGKYSYLSSTAKDVALGQYYTPYMEWAIRNGIIALDSSGNAYPNSTVTREEIADIIYKFSIWFSNDTVQRRISVLKAGSIYDGLVTWKVHDNVDEILSAFSDNSEITPEYRSAFAYAVAEGVFAGSNGKLNPKGNLTRFEAAQIITTVANVFLRAQYDNLSYEIADRNGFVQH